MKKIKNSKRNIFIKLFTLVFALLLCVGTGFSVWYFQGDKYTTAELEQNSIKIDDIKEDYNFGTNKNEENLYNVYFFPSPLASEWKYNGLGYENPKDYYLAGNSVANYQNDFLGYWTKNSTDTSDGTIFGYKAFEGVTKKITVKQYLSLGNPKTNKKHITYTTSVYNSSSNNGGYGNDRGWSSSSLYQTTETYYDLFFVGYTTDYEVAYNNYKEITYTKYTVSKETSSNGWGGRDETNTQSQTTITYGVRDEYSSVSYSNIDLFDYSLDLSNYADSSNNVYLYALYCSSTGYDKETVNSQTVDKTPFIYLTNQRNQNLNSYNTFGSTKTTGDISYDSSQLESTSTSSYTNSFTSVTSLFVDNELTEYLQGKSDTSDYENGSNYEYFFVKKGLTYGIDSDSDLLSSVATGSLENQNYELVVKEGTHITDSNRQDYQTLQSYQYRHTAYFHDSETNSHSLDGISLSKGIYNIYVYFNCNTGEDSSSSTFKYRNKVIGSSLDDYANNYYYGTKRIVSSTEAKVYYKNNNYFLVYIFLEKVYDFELLGEIANTYSYYSDDKENQVQFYPSVEWTEGGYTDTKKAFTEIYGSSNSAYCNNLYDGTANANTEMSSKIYETYYTDEVLVSSSDSINFNMNCGDTYVDDGYPEYYLDGSATEENGIEAKYLSSDGTYVNYTFSGKKCYYLESNMSKVSESNYSLLCNNTNDQNLPIFKVNSSGTYRFRMVTEFDKENKRMSRIWISAAKVDGTFMEFFKSNPVDHLSSDTDSTFVDHSSYLYRVELDYDADININNTYTFTYNSNIDSFNYDGLSKTYTCTLKEFISTVYGSSAILYDHTLGKYLMLSSDDGFSTDGLSSGSLKKSWKDSITCTKNYIFYKGE